MSEWKEYRLGEIAETNAKSLSKDFLFNEIEYLDTGSITCNKIESLQKFDLKNAPSRAKRLVEHEDIIYSTVRPNQLHYGFMNYPKENLVVSTGFVTITSDRCKIVPLFLYYYLTQKQIIEFLHSIAEASTSTYPSLKPSDLESLDLLIPPLPEQKAIASVLGSLDDKIDLLHRQNTTLEAMAETLFRQYFVEEAKEDWETVKLGELVEVKGGSTPSTTDSRYWNGTFHWTTPKDITNNEGIFLFDTERKITELGLNKISSGLLDKGTLIMTSRAPVGIFAFSNIPIAINQGYIAILDNKGISKEFIYLWLKENIELVHSYSNGSTFMEISKSAFKSLQIQLPPKTILSDFQKLSKPFFNKILQNQIQIRTLTSIRDTLLPKLMSGEVRVRE